MLLIALAALPTRAQDEASDDKTFLENWLETNLSSAGREVRVTGFAGALSSRATIEELTIADDDGVWLALRGVQLDWTRTALLAGRLAVDNLSANEIEISRRPVTEPATPQATASEFSLPELPVSINIGKIEAARVILGEPVLGVAAEVRLEGSGQLEGGAGSAKLVLERIDGAEGALTFAGSYNNESRVLSLDLNLSEGPDGIVATLTGLPGGAPLGLTVAGDGPLEDFTADVALITDGVDRLSGQVLLSADAPATDAALGFRADLAGDPSPLFAGEYGRFFGTDVRLALAGERHPDGRLDIADFEIATEALALAGSGSLNSKGWIERANLSGTIAAADGAPVLLPLGGTPTRVDRAEVAFDYDMARGAGWTGTLVVNGVARDDLALASARIDGAGTLYPGEDDQVPRIAGRLDFTATGIAPSDADLAAALGPTLAGGLDFAREESAPLRLSDISLAGTDYDLAGATTLRADWSKLDLVASGDLAVNARDLSRFSGLAGKALGGAARLRIAGDMAVPGGPFDLTIEGSGKDLAIGQPWFDQPFAGASTLSIAAARDETATRIERFAIAAAGASARGTATLAPDASRVEAHVEVPDARLLHADLTGALTLDGTAHQTGESWQVVLDATAPGDTTARLNGVVGTARSDPITMSGEIEARVGSLSPYSGIAGRALSGGASVTARGTFAPDSGAFTLEGLADGQDLRFGLGDLDRLTGGASRADFAIARDGDGDLRIERLVVETPELTASLTDASTDAEQRVNARARLRDLGLVVPGLTGAFTGEGSAVLNGTGWEVSATGAGPGGTAVRASGQIASDVSRATLALSGRAPLALANAFIAPQQAAGMARFDLDLNGPFALASLSGTVSTDDGRLALPALRIALEPISATARISGAQATIDAAANVSSGGRITITGPISLSAPYNADLAVRAEAVGLTDPALYDTVANGTVTIAGPLTGGATLSGRIAFGTIELRVPETGFGVDGGLPGLQHIAEPAAVAVTRQRAGLTNGQSGNGGRPYALDIMLSAPSRVFLRGRGLDAEMGGVLHLGGTTQNMITDGGFHLIRGRLDLLGNRLELTEGTATLQGSLDPFIRLVAETRAGDVVVRITLEGLASDPNVTFTSTPDLPEDEILARLVFGRGLDQISAFQALNLASAVATLSGKGGAGVIGRLRESFGLDDLDVTTDAEGEVAVRAGTYITDNIYTDVTVGADGRSEINLNLSITPNITARGGVTSDGDTGIGIFYEKDY